MPRRVTPDKLPNGQPDPMGRIFGTVDLNLQKIGTVPPGLPTIKYVEVPVLTEEWRPSLDLYLNLNSAQAFTNLGPNTGSNTGNNSTLTVRVYVQTGSVKSLVYQGTVGDELNQPQNFNSFPTYPVDWQARDHLIARVRSDCGEKYIVTLQTTIAGQSDAVAQQPFFLSYAAHSDDTDVEPPSRWVTNSGVTNQAGSTIFTLGGCIHEAMFTNLTALDAWVWLFDLPTSPSFISPVPNGTPGLVMPLYVPPNAKGLASFNFGDRRGLWTRYSLYWAMSSTPGTFTFGAALFAQFSAKVS
jgi:hypothetical protein